MKVRVEVTRQDGSKVMVNRSRENYLGFTGYTDDGELIVAYSDGVEAFPSDTERVANGPTRLIPDAL